MKQLFLFCYGSNLNSQQLRRRIGKTTLLRLYNLENYRLVFNCGGFANIEPSQGEVVEGALYSINSSQLSELNRYETFYNPNFFDLENNGLGIVYIGDPHFINNWQKPRLEYINIILQGMSEHKLINSYNKLLSFKEQNFTLKKGNKFKLLKF